MFDSLSDNITVEDLTGHVLPLPGFAHAVGGGGNADVYKQEYCGRLVAVKVLRTVTIRDLESLKRVSAQCVVTVQ
jgi:hypothetical protein